MSAGSALLKAPPAMNSYGARRPAGPATQVATSTREIVGAIVNTVAPTRQALKGALCVNTTWRSAAITRLYRDCWASLWNSGTVLSDEVARCLTKLDINGEYGEIPRFPRLKQWQVDRSVDVLELHRLEFLLSEEIELVAFRVPVMATPEFCQFFDKVLSLPKLREVRLHVRGIDDTVQRLLGEVFNRRYDLVSLFSETELQFSGRERFPEHGARDLLDYFELSRTNEVAQTVEMRKFNNLPPQILAMMVASSHDKVKFSINCNASIALKTALTELDDEVFGGSSASIYMEGDAVDDNVVEFIDRFCGISSLHLSNFLKEPGTLAILHRFHNLEKLTLVNCDAFPYQLAEILPNLHTFKVSFSEFAQQSPLDMELINALSAMSNLTHLIIRHSWMPQTQLLLPLSSCRNLTTLVVHTHRPSERYYPMIFTGLAEPTRPVLFPNLQLLYPPLSWQAASHRDDSVEYMKRDFPSLPQEIEKRDGACYFGVSEKTRELRRFDYTERQFLNLRWFF